MKCGVVTQFMAHTADAFAIASGYLVNESREKLCRSIYREYVLTYFPYFVYHCASQE